MANVTFLQQVAPVDEYGRGLYAVARSVLRAMLDQLSSEDLGDLNVERDLVTLRQLSKVARIGRDKGLRGDGFEWAVHEAVLGGEPLVTGPISEVLRKASRYLEDSPPTSLLFGHERARYLGFLDAVIENAGEEAVLLPDGRGHPYAFGTWVAVAARGKPAERVLADRIKGVWKSDLFLSNQERVRYFAATVKSNHRQLEAGRGLRIGIVPEAKDLQRGVHRVENLWVVALPDPDGFMGLFNDGYNSVGRAICTLGKHEPPPYYAKPSAKAQRLQEQLEKYATAKVVDVVDALNEAAQQNLITSKHRLLSVDAPPWLRMVEKDTVVIAPRPSFEKLD
jgi:hypothetical protein